MPGPGEALVEVHAAGITFAELTWDLSWTTKDGQDRTPVIPSHEVSGVVARLGPGANGVAAGEEMYGLIEFDRDGAAAEFVTVPAAHLAAKPASISHAEAATLPLAALEPGERVLVQGGAGGVGGYVVQLAAILGGDLTATGRAEDRDFVHELGAASYLAIDEEEGAPEKFNVVIDTVGGPVLDASYGLARPGGRLVTLSAPRASPSHARRARRCSASADVLSKRRVTCEIPQVTLGSEPATRCALACRAPSRHGRRAPKSPRAVYG